MADVQLQHTAPRKVTWSTSHLQTVPHEHILNCWARAKLGIRAGTGDRSPQVKQ